MIIETPEYFETEILNDIKCDILSQMTELERKFLNGVVRQVKPKKILEVGVAAGGSSAIILNATKDIKDSVLYAIDYDKSYNIDTSKKSGFIIEEKFPQFLDKYKIYRGGVSAKFLEDIGGDIDLCLIDTVHSNPGEILDFLMVLPFLKKNAVVLIHDIFISSTCFNLFNTIRGTKITFKNKNEIFNNYGIGAIILDDDIKNHLLNNFLLLKENWTYMPTDEDIEYTINIFNKYYSKEFIDLFMKIVEINKYIYTNVEIDMKFINKLAWWISNSGKRYEFRLKNRNKFYQKYKKEAIKKYNIKFL